MSTNEVILAIFCAVLVVFSLVVAIFVPKRNPDFPGRKMGAFFLVSAALVAGMLTAVEFFGAEEESEAEAAQPAEAAAPAEPAEPSAPAPAEPGGGTEPPPGDPAAGKDVFASQPCGDCHTLADAVSTGAVGPNLDELKPSFDAVVEAVTNGRGGIMPAFSGQLSEEQIANLAAYIVQVTAG